MNTITRVAVIDDHQIFREGLIELLRTFDDISLVAEGASSADAIRIARTISPDVILLDLDMPGSAAPSMAGLEAVDAITVQHPEIKIVILTMHDDPGVVRRLIQSGISSYLTKSSGRKEVHAAICAAMRGGDSLLVNVSRATANSLSHASPAQPMVLTARELEVLGRLAATGGSNQHIAAELHISEATVKRHLATVYDKLGIHTRIQAVRRARLLGLLDE
jgi:DNA-binding NarL/FixJ family response regulator